MDKQQAYKITKREADGSRLEYIPQHGTVLNTALPRAYVFSVDEIDDYGRHLCNNGEYRSMAAAIIGAIELHDQSEEAAEIKAALMAIAAKRNQ